MSSTFLAWGILIFAGLLEIIWAIAMKYSEGFTRLIPSLLAVFFIALSIYLLSLATKQIPIGTAYAVWAGIGAVGVTVFGILIFNEPTSFIHIACLVLIVSGVVGLNLLST
ncbi:MAG: QacE family quaternary ammonium compound efflux SMR transporter [Methylophaga sp.]|nr:MAG: QacE family quaternary ammonium compound efflux SMR transporter [Methylophaga sp.]